LKRSQDLAERLKLLQKKLDKAVGDEDFETAVQLRDEINQVKSRMNELTTG
jgi:protein-arginine kinase activator protein McsA